MSKNFDMIATVGIDLATPVVDDTSFDNLLIMGPAPKSDAACPAVGVYTNIGAVEDAGFVVTGENADPVGMAASIAFSQSPRPTQVYIAVQKPSARAVMAAETIAKANALVEQTVGTKEGMTGCTTAFNAESRTMSIVLTGPTNEVKNTGIFDTIKALTESGYTVSIDGKAITDSKAFLSTESGKKVVKMAKGDETVTFEIVVGTEGGNDVIYRVNVAYPADGAAALADVVDEPVNEPDKELEGVTETIARALAVSGWYVLCPAGIDPSHYAEMAAYVETQEKMLCYTETAMVPAVGNTYFRTMAVYGCEDAQGTISAANQYINVALAAKWLHYASGSETAAFKTLAGVNPAALTQNEMTILADKHMTYFITVGSKNISMNGQVVAGEWADIIRFRDWLKNDMQVRVVNLFTVNPKIPYTDAGIALIQNQMIAALKAGQDAGGIAETEYDADGNEIAGFQTSVPLAASISASEKAGRKLTKCKFRARLAGAIHFAELNGSLTYEL